MRSIPIRIVITARHSNFTSEIAVGMNINTTIITKLTIQSRPSILLKLVLIIVKPMHVVHACNHMTMGKHNKKEQTTYIELSNTKNIKPSEDSITPYAAVNIKKKIYLYGEVYAYFG
jgi:hypothetical protein